MQSARGPLRQALIARGALKAKRAPRRAAVKKVVKAILRRRGELKCRLFPVAGALSPAVAGTPIPTCAAAVASLPITPIIPTGANFNDREGNQVLLRKINMHINIDASNTPAVSLLRMIVFWDRQPTFVGGVLTPATYGQMFRTNNGVGNFIVAPFDPNEKRRFKVIYDRYWKWQPMNQGNLTAQAQHNRKLVLNFKESRLAWNGVNSVDVQGPHLFYFIVTDVNANQPALRLDGNILFRDPQ